MSVYFDSQQPAAVWDAHKHPEVQFLYFGAASDCTIHWAQNGAWVSRHVQAPSLWAIGAGVTHKLEWRRPALRLALYVQPTFVAEFDGLEITGSSLFPFETAERCNPRIAEFLRDFERLEQPRNIVELLAVESSAHLAALHLCQAWGCLIKPADSWEIIMGNEAVAKINAFIDERIDQKILVADMARAVGMGESKLTSVLKQRTGMSPGSYLIKRRIQKSKTLLIETNWTIGGIALAVGFSSQGHFDFYFKKLTGKTPKEFRMTQ